MRLLFAASIILLGAITAQAQEQEQKLLDRLLKPNMELQNGAQDRQFVAGGATITKQARTKSFFVRKRKADKEFWDTRQVTMKEFNTSASRYNGATANLNTRSKLAKVNVAYSTAAYGDTRAAVDSDKAVPNRDYASGKRPFLVKGKSQKALSQKDTPLTIDQVRELLNKNK